MARFCHLSTVVVVGFSACATRPPAPSPIASLPPPIVRPVPPTALPEPAIAERITPDAPFRQQRPAPGPDKPFKVPSVKRFTLKNGLKVILAESHKLPLVSLELVIKTGNAANPRGLAGLADMTANMLDEGTRTRSALQIAEEISSLGATLGTNASWDASSVAVSSLSENIEPAMAVWADVLLNPAFEEKEFSRVQNNLLTALSRRKDSPPQVANLTFARVLYGADHPYGWPDTGTTETVQAMKIADLRKFHDSFYRPTNAVLVAAGDISEADLRKKVDGLLKSWKAKPAPRVTFPRTTPPGRTEIFLVDKAGAPQSSIRVGLMGLERTNPDYYKAMVMNQILGGSFKRLFLNLREQKGWTYGVTSLFLARRSPGPWVAQGEFVANHTADSVSEILKEVRGMRDGDVTDGELKETQDEIIKAFPARFASVNQIAAQMASLAVYGLPENDLETFSKRIAAVTKKDVRAMAQKYLHPDKLVIVVVGDRQSNEGPLRKIAEVQVRDSEGMPIASGSP